MDKKIYILLFTFEFLILSQPAHAYLDPGTGSMLLQAIIGAVAAALMFGRTYIYKIKLFFSRTKEEKISDMGGNEGPK